MQEVPPQTGGAVTYRMDERTRCALEASLRAAEGCTDQLEFSEREEISVLIEDLSPGGLRVISKTFAPVGADVLVRVSADGHPQTALTCRVKRAQMLDRTPRYALGLAVVGDTARVRPLLASVMKSASGNEG